MEQDQMAPRRKKGTQLKMRSKTFILLIMMGLLPSIYLLWMQSRQLDLGMDLKIQQSEQERHEFVISHDFDQLKANLIEVHRDHWIAVGKQQTQTRVETVCLSLIVLLLVVLAIREYRSLRTSAQQRQAEAEIPQN